MSRFTPETAEALLAIPVFYILAEKARPIFPQTRTSSPSEKVLIAKLAKVREVDAPYFPTSVNWIQWEDSVLPVLEDEELKARSPLFRRALQDGRVEDWVNLVGKKLRLSFKAAGYGSPDV